MFRSSSPSREDSRRSPRSGAQSDLYSRQDHRQACRAQCHNVQRRARASLAFRPCWDAVGQAFADVTLQVRTGWQDRDTDHHGSNSTEFQDGGGAGRQNSAAARGQASAVQGDDPWKPDPGSRAERWRESNFNAHRLRAQSRAGSGGPFRRDAFPACLCRVGQTVSQGRALAHYRQSRRTCALRNGSAGLPGASCPDRFQTDSPGGRQGRQSPVIAL